MSKSAFKKLTCVPIFLHFFTYFDFRENLSFLQNQNASQRCPPGVPNPIRPQSGRSVNYYQEITYG